jgi:hypothetical protein
MKFFARLSLAVVLCLPAAPLFAAEGVLLVQRVTTGTKVTTNQVQLEKDRMRAETSDATGAKQAIVFDGPKQVMTTINFDAKTYTEMTKAEADQMGAQVSDAMAQMQEAMARMPPAQRAQMEAQMQGMMRGRGPAAPKTEYRKTGSDKVGKWACDKYEGFQNNEKVAEVCTVDPKALGFSAADFEITKQMTEFFKKMVPAGAARNGEPFTLGTGEAGGFSGIPVRSISYDKGQIASTTEITEVSRQNFPASSYAVPAGFQKQEMFGGRGRGRGRGVTP